MNLWTKRVTCPDCGQQRTVRKDNQAIRCGGCHAKHRNLAGLNNPNWKGGVYISGAYAYVPDGRGGTIKRATLILEQKLGRPLRWGYEGHHINLNSLDDRPENLMEKLEAEHAAMHNKLRKQPQGVDGKFIRRVVHG